MRNFSDRLSDLDRVDVDGTSHLPATLLQEIPENVPWYMTGSIAVNVLEDGYSEVIVNVMKWQRFLPILGDHA